ncbi:hypothetical protein KY290_012962 [Solanum tuberosum]|uniref:Uncharacterized protein n=1 Tax=Solanum tuberosum TaxID=4113 RepID=A0ABQ7VKB8_SOLTU|nr:hypothetical protein KY285_012727 [Solanum tuberosum]KAH0768981.1 hypothetical protein KY290_012962 [Solanum tuberosum]
MAHKCKNVDVGASSKRSIIVMLPGLLVAEVLFKSLESKQFNNMAMNGLDDKNKLNISKMSMSMRWDRNKDTARDTTLHYENLKQVARVQIVCSVFLPAYDWRFLVTDDETESLAECYPLTDSAAYMCRMGPTFHEPLDDDVATTDETMDDEDDGADVDENATALMAFYGTSDMADGHYDDDEA